jgi:hypothetical protein
MLNPEATSVLEQLAALIRERNEIDLKIAKLIGRPALSGHLGEFVASQVFGIELEIAATTAGHDGRFVSGPMAGKTVNIKAYGKRENVLDINPDHVPDFYLVLAGPKTELTTSRGGHRPWVISEVFLFDARALIDRIRLRKTKIGVATSVPSAEWENARVFPPSPSSPLNLSDKAVEMLTLFRGQRVGGV